MTGPLIAGDNLAAVFAVLITVVAMGMAMERHPRLGQYGAMFVILFPTLLSALSLTPRASPVYGFVTGDLIALAIPLVLFNANLRVIWRESGRVMGAFLISTLTVVVGAALAMAFVDLGANEGIWAALVAASFIGGSVNMAAVGGSLGVLDDPLLGMMVAAVYVVLIPYFALIMALPSIRPLWRLFSPRTEPTPGNFLGQSAASASERPFSVFAFAAAIALAAVFVVIGDGLVALTAMVPLKFLAISILAAGFATLLPVQAKRIQGHNELGQILIYLFLAVLGVRIDFSLATNDAVPVIIYVIVVLSIHIVLLSLSGRLFRLTGPELMIAGNACILGPPTAAAQAVSRGWAELVTPGILVGVFGWVIASFVGVAFASFFM